MPAQFQLPASIVQSAGLFPTATAATAASAAPVLAEATAAGALGGGLGSLFSFAPVGLFAALALSRILDRNGLQATQMTPEEAAKFAAQERLSTAAQGVGEGAGEFLLDAIEQAKAANVTPEQIAETLNTRGDIVSELIGLTVGNNQPFVDVAAANAGGNEQIADLNENTTASTITGGLGDGSLGDAADLGTVDQSTVSDVNEEWTYDKATDSFISSTRGDRIPNAGNADLKDGGVYTVTPVIGSDGVMAEHVVDTDTNESVGIFSIDINTGLPSINKSVDVGSTNTGTDVTNGNTGTTNAGTGDTTGSGNDFETARDVLNTGTILTAGKVISNGSTDGTTNTNGNGTSTGTSNGSVAEEGTGDRPLRGGGSGRREGLFQAIQETPVVSSILFEPRLTKLDNVKQGMFGEFLRAFGGTA